MVRGVEIKRCKKVFISYSHFYNFNGIGIEITTLDEDISIMSNDIFKLIIGI